MARRQTRRCISIKGTTYARVQLALQAVERRMHKQGKCYRIEGSVSDFIEQTLAERLDELDVPDVSHEQVRAHVEATRSVVTSREEKLEELRRRAFG